MLKGLPPEAYIVKPSELFISGFLRLTQSTFVALSGVPAASTQLLLPSRPGLPRADARADAPAGGAEGGAPDAAAQRRRRGGGMQPASGQILGRPCHPHQSGGLRPFITVLPPGPGMLARSSLPRLKSHFAALQLFPHRPSRPRYSPPEHWSQAALPLHEALPPGLRHGNHGYPLNAAGHHPTGAAALNPHYQRIY